MPVSSKVEATRHRPMSEATLETLAAMVDEEMVLLDSSATHSHAPGLMAIDGRGRARPERLPFKLGRPVLDALHARGFIERGDAVRLDKTIRERNAAAGKPPRVNQKGEPLSAFAWYDIPYVATEEGRAALEAERGRLADIRAARKHAAEHPRLVVAARAEYGKRLPGAGQLLRVLRETEGRFYVEHANEDGTRAERAEWSGLVKGGAPDQYVDKEDVVAVDVTPEQWRAMRRATEDFASSVAAADGQAQSEIAPILRRAAERKEQLKAQLEDEMREAMGKAPEPPRASKAR